MKHTIHSLKIKTLALFIMLATILTIMPNSILPTFAEPSYPYTVDESVITNYPTQFEDYVPGEPVSVTAPLEDLDWPEPPSYIHRGYDGSPAAYTARTSAQFNGYSTPDHVVFDGGTVRFLGYGVSQYMDMVFTDAYSGGFTSLAFTMRPIVMNFHSFSESGMLFNGSFTDQNGDINVDATKNIYYTGYALVLKCSNLAGMLENSTSAPNTAFLSLMYLEKELMNGNHYNPGTIVQGSTRTLIAICKDGITNLTTPTFEINIERDYKNGKFMVYVDGLMVADVAAPKSASNGFGFFTGYYGHSCAILSVMQYEQVEATVVDEPIQTNATVKFVDIKTRAEIAEPQTIAGNAAISYATDQFKVTPPQKIGDYNYVRASRKNLDPITYKQKPTENVITLYYNMEIEASKSAAIDGIVDNGTEDTPVPVAEGDVIDYTITVNNPLAEIDVSEGATSSFVDVWVGKRHNIARDSNGDIYVWGWDYYGELGLGGRANGGNNYISTPTRNDFLSNRDITDIWVGDTHNIARDSDGNIYVWGYNSYGELGLAGYSTYSEPTRNDFLSDLDIDEIWAGGNFNIARTDDGEFYVWGYNSYGELGLGGTSRSESEPVRNDILSAMDIDEIWVGYDFTIVRDDDGLYYTWGSNGFGQLGRGSSGSLNKPTLNSNLNELSPSIDQIWVGDYSVIARSSNEDVVYGWGYNSVGDLGLGETSSSESKPVKNDILSGKGIIELWMGPNHSVACAEDGNYYVWGWNINGQLGNGGTGSSVSEPQKNDNLKNLGFTDIWGGYEHTIGRAEDGLYYGWGSGYSGQLGTGVLEQLTKPAKINALNCMFDEIWVGGNSSIGRTLNGDVYVWGYNSGNLGLGDSANKHIPIKNDKLTELDITYAWIGKNHTIVRARNGDIYVSGSNGNGQLGLGGTNTRNTEFNKNTILSDLSNTVGIADISIGGYHTIVLTENGDVYACGQNTYGQLGEAGTHTTPDLVTYFNGINVTDIWGGENHTIARDEDGNIYVWGVNDSRQLGIAGNESTTNKTTPYKNDDLTARGIANIWVGDDHNIASTFSGDYYVWGDNSYGKLGLGNTTAQTTIQKNRTLSDMNIEEVWTGGNYNIVRISSGDYYVWGYNPCGQLGTGTYSYTPVTVPTLNETFKNLGFVDIFTGYQHAIACGPGGRFYVWGNHYSGQLGLGARGSNLGTSVTSPTKGPFQLTETSHFSITDLLPKGLKLLKDDNGDLVYSITDENNVNAYIGEDSLIYTGTEADRDRITFEFTVLPHGITKFNFSVTVDDEGYFENIGQFYDARTGKTYDTDSTYHATGLVTVTEKYQKWSNTKGDTLQADTHRRFNPELVTDPTNPLYDKDNPPTDSQIHYSPYQSILQPITDSAGDTWRYYAYQRKEVDDEPIIGQPPNGINDWTGTHTDSEYPWCWKNVNEDHDITFYFVKDVNVSIQYKDYENQGDEGLKKPYTASVPALENYNMAVSHMNSIDGGWNYAGYYSLDGGTTVKPGVPPTPTYTAIQMGNDQNIVLYFTKSHSVTVQYREYRADATDILNSQLLFNNGVNKETFILDIGDDFDPMAKTTVEAAIKDGVDSIIGKKYTIYQGWSNDGGATVHLGENPPVFENITDNMNIILYFSTTYVIMEKFHPSTAPYDSLMPDIISLVLGGDTFSGNPPEEIYSNGARWVYIGYKFTSDQDYLQAKDSTPYYPPVIENIAGEEIIIYVYEKKEPSSDLTVVERFREKDNTGHILQPDRENVVELNTFFLRDYPELITPDQQTTEYTYWGYQINNEPPEEGEFEGITIDKAYTITYLYTLPDVGDYTLHIRQIVVGTSDGLKIPEGDDKGFFRLTNDEKTVHVTGPSGLEEDGIDFAEYLLTVGGDGLYTVQGIIPQYYAYYGYYANPGENPDAKHGDSDERKTDEIVLDYNDEKEWWVTVYINPTKSPGDYDWGFKTNEVGTILELR